MDPIVTLAANIAVICSLLHSAGVPVCFFVNYFVLLELGPPAVSNKETLLRLAFDKLANKNKANVKRLNTFIDDPARAMLVVDLSIQIHIYTILSIRQKTRWVSRIISALDNALASDNFNDISTQLLYATYTPHFNQLIQTVNDTNVDQQTLLRFSTLFSKVGRYLIYLGVISDGITFIQEGESIYNHAYSENITVVPHINQIATDEDDDAESIIIMLRLNQNETADTRALADAAASLTLE